MAYISHPRAINPIFLTALIDKYVGIDLPNVFIMRSFRCFSHTNSSYMCILQTVNLWKLYQNYIYIKIDCLLCSGRSSVSLVLGHMSHWYMFWWALLHDLVQSIPLCMPKIEVYQYHQIYKFGNHNYCASSHTSLSNTGYLFASKFQNYDRNKLRFSALLLRTRTTLDNLKKPSIFAIAQ